MSGYILLFVVVLLGAGACYQSEKVNPSKDRMVTRIERSDPEPGTVCYTKRFADSVIGFSCVKENE